MAKVSHKKVRQLMDEKRSKITDRQFFTSRILAGHFEDIAAAQTRRYRYNRRVHVSLYWDPKDPNLACTDNTVIRVNCSHKMVTKTRGRPERYQIVCGLFTHELGHVLYTDFLCKQTYLRYLEFEKWYPDRPALTTTLEDRHELDFWSYCKAEPRNLQLIQQMASFIANTLEDGYVEARMLNQFTGVLGSSLEQMRQNQFDDMPTVDQMIEQENDDSSHIFLSILQIMLSYAKFGQIKYGSTPLSDERIQVIFRMLPKLDHAVTTTSAKERWKVVSYIMIHCWEHLHDYLELCKQKQDDAASAGDSASAGDILQSLLKGIKGSSEAVEGDGTPIAGSESGSISNQSAARAATRALAAASGESEADEKESDGSGKEENETAAEASKSDSGDTDQESFSENQSGKSGKQQVSDTPGGHIPHTQTDQVSEPVGGEFEYDPEYQREQYENAASDIERMLDQMAERAANRQLENERLQELNETAQSISYGNIHSGVKVTVHRIDQVDDELEEQYNAICDPLLTISKQLQRNLIQKLKDQQRGGKQTGLVMGRRLDAHALCRNDGKVFYKNQLPNEIPRISVGLLLDESGSMGSYDRCTYARAAAIILYDFCHSLNIPIMIYGHSCEYGSGVELYSYAEFDSIDHDDRYRLMDISARGCNRDGAPLRFMAEQLSKRQEEVRILILVSDGQPSASGYGGTAAEEDLRRIKQEYKRKGILFVAAAIGEDKPNIERIYGDSFLDITDLNQLPVKLTSVIKQFLR